MSFARIAALSLFLACWPLAAPAQGPMDRGLAIQALKHTDYGLRFLRDRQAADGSWSGSVHVTALALYAFLRSYQGYNEEDGAFITRPVAYLLGQVNGDGSIGDDPTHRVRDTAAAMIALEATGNPDHAPVIARAGAFLAGMQLDEDDGIGPDDPRYGGIPDGPAAQPDVLTLYRALAALQDTGSAAANPVRARALVFLGRSQIEPAGHGQPGGGFAASPAAAAAQRPAPEALMTYAGLAALFFAGADTADPRVAAARGWIATHHDVDTAPPADRRFLLYDAFAVAMLGDGANDIAGTDGVTHNWRDELVRAIVPRNNADGSWGDAGDDANRTTALAVGTLDRIVHSLR